ncbi:MAG: hypothetical protein JXA89_09620 [Anaerolineae bacterium]|nr:hypothetical protein [Anaerolineae bacterium]
MKLKLILGTLAAVLVFGLAGGTAFAADSLQRQGGLGRVIDIQGEVIIVENQLGTFDIHTDGETVFRVRGVEQPTIDDVSVGDLVAGRVEKQDDGTLLAKLVTVMPSPGRRLRGLGRVTAVGADSLTVEIRNGEAHTILIDADTKFRIKDVEDATLADIQVGDVVAGAVVKQEDGTLLAKLVVVVPPKGERVRGLGKVTAVGQNSLTVETRNGKTHTILVDAGTKFRIKDVEEPTLADVQVGDVVAGVVVKQDDDTLLAKLVAVMPPRSQ